MFIFLLVSPKWKKKKIESKDGNYKAVDFGFTLQRMVFHLELYNNSIGYLVKYQFTALEVLKATFKWS